MASRYISCYLNRFLLIKKSLSKLLGTYKVTMTNRVFVYGTLKHNEPNHHWLTDTNNGCSQFLCNGTTKTKYPLIIATRYNIPFLLYKPGEGDFIEGEVYEVDDLMLSKLDILEEHPNYYEREMDEIVVKGVDEKNPTIVRCWVYFMKRFKPEMLMKPLLKNYSSSGPHGLAYLESNNESTIDDLSEMDDVVMNQ